MLRYCVDAVYLFNATFVAISLQDEVLLHINSQIVSTEGCKREREGWGEMREKVYFDGTQSFFGGTSAIVVVFYVAINDICSRNCCGCLQTNAGTCHRWVKINWYNKVYVSGSRPRLSRVRFAGKQGFGVRFSNHEIRLMQPAGSWPREEKVRLQGRVRPLAWVRPMKVREFHARKGSVI
ncbi:hypothetical protein R6Q59_020099 [Mikania micrantha]